MKISQEELLGIMQRVYEKVNVIKAEDEFTTKDFAEAFGISSETARAKLYKAVEIGAVSCRRDGRFTYWKEIK